MCLFCFTVLSCECIFLCVLCCLMFIVMFHIQLQLMQRVVLSCECIFLCVLYCLMFIVMFHIRMQLMQRLDHWNELYVCMYVCVRKTRVQVYEHYRFKHEYVQNWQQRCSLPYIGIHLHHYQPNHGLRQ